MKFWRDIEPGFQIPDLIKMPDYKQVFMYSAITWNRHLIHYNISQANREGHKDIVVQRALIGCYLSQMLTDWVKENGFLRRLEWKVLQSAFPGDILTCRGYVTGKELIGQKIKIFCDVNIENQIRGIVAKGHAIILSN